MAHICCGVEALAMLVHHPTFFTIYFHPTVWANLFWECSCTKLPNMFVYSMHYALSQTSSHQERQQPPNSSGRFRHGTKTPSALSTEMLGGCSVISCWPAVLAAGIGPLFFFCEGMLWHSRMQRVRRSLKVEEQLPYKKSVTWSIQTPTWF